MSTRLYPLYQRGNPQLRVFLPNFWMKLIRPEEPLPPNQVLFQTSLEMTEHDVKNYLEKIYKVPVVEVKATIKMGPIVLRRFFGPAGSPRLVKQDDYKEALVTMPKDYTFEYPELIPENQEDQETKMANQMKENLRNSQKGNVYRIPAWFKSF